MEVWCVQLAAAQAPCMRGSQNKVLGTRVFTVSCAFFRHLARINKENRRALTGCNEIRIGFSGELWSIREEFFEFHV